MKKYNYMVISIILLLNISCDTPQTRNNSNIKKINRKIYTASEKNTLFLPYPNIPLNQSFETFSVKLSKLIKIYKSNIPYVAFISQYKLLNRFSGIYQKTNSLSLGYDDELFLNNTIAHRYSYWTHNISNDISNIKIYTYKKINNSQETIFMLTKKLKSSNLGYILRFNAMVNSISNKIGSNPKLYNTKFQNNIHINNNTYEPANVAIWNTHKTKILLLVRKNYYLSEASIIFISKPGWENYFKECKIADRKQLNNIKNQTNGF